MGAEIESYRMFTKPAELHKAVNTLRGIVAGITTDTAIHASEMDELVHWCEIHAHLRDRHPFSELLPVVETACADGKITDEESKDILWLCNNFVDDSDYYDVVTSSIQFLCGMIHGMMADRELADAEILALRSWVEANRFLSGTYPFDEIESLLSAILSDKKISAEERDQLVGFFGNVIEFKNSRNLVERDFTEMRAKYDISGICAQCPDIIIADHRFCFTGASYKGTRAKLEAEIERLGGIVTSGVSAKTDYLVVGNAGNPCWAYSCHGRKIEEAINLRKQGVTIAIVNETDFWDAVEDINANIAD